MGLIICSTHGETGFMPFVSNELVDKVLNGIYIEKKELTYVDVVFIDENDGEEMYKARYWMTNSCFKSLNAEREYIVESDEGEARIDTIFDSVMKGGGICGKCFTDYVEQLK